MKKWIWVIVVVVAVLAALISSRAGRHEVPRPQNVVVSAGASSYWTCPMHPQIHAEHAGECPICHMKLVQVKAKALQSEESARGDERAQVAAAPAQMPLLGIQRAEVEKMALRLKIPVSGRFISSSGVAFQIYESDIRFVRAGLSFKGENGFYPDEEVSGVISSIDNIVDPTSRTIRVVGAVREGPRRALPESGFRGEIVVELKDRVAIPESSVLHTGAGDLVYLFLKGNELAPTKVKIGIKSEGFYDVLSGLQPGQIISSGPNFLLDSESKIRAASSPPAGGKNAPATPSCPEGQHWDIPMSMCMPGKG